MVRLRRAWQETITPGRFARQTGIVTGGASGIGRATASRVAREGGRVVAVDVSADRLTQLADALTGLDVVTVTGDITDQTSIDVIIDTAGSRIDGLANVAGINDDFSPLHETTDAMWDPVIGINLTGTFKLTRAVLPRSISSAAISAKRSSAAASSSSRSGSLTFRPASRCSTHSG